MRSSPTSPTDVYIPVLVAESACTYEANSSKQNREESLTITSKRENDKNRVAEIYTQKDDPYRRSECLLSNEGN